MKHVRKRYYVVFRGENVNEPTLFSSWAKTHKRVSGYPNNLYFGFEDFEGAINKIEASGARSFFVDKDIDFRDSRPTRGCQRIYGVANGDKRGLYGTYSGMEGAKIQVDHFSHACHKSFRYLEDATKFCQEREDSSTSFHLIVLLSNITVEEITETAMQDLSIYSDG